MLSNTPVYVSTKCSKKGVEGQRSLRTYPRSVTRGDPRDAIAKGNVGLAIAAEWIRVSLTTLVQLQN